MYIYCAQNSLFQSNAINRHFEETIASIDKEHEKLRKLVNSHTHRKYVSVTNKTRATQLTKNATSKNLSGLIQVYNWHVPHSFPPINMSDTDSSIDFHGALFHCNVVCNRYSVNACKKLFILNLHSG
jgi:hypothetical protein